jgi:hypothetical protein
MTTIRVMVTPTMIRYTTPKGVVERPRPSIYVLEEQLDALWEANLETLTPTYKEF